MLKSVIVIICCVLALLKNWMLNCMKFRSCIGMNMFMREIGVKMIVKV